MSSVPEESLWFKLASHVEVIVPGAWAGFLLVLLAAYYAGDRTHKLIEDVGTVLVIPIVFFVGVVFYLVYRVIIGEWVLYPIRHAVHGVLDWAWRRRAAKENDFISFTRLLARMGVGFGSRRQVYSAVRDLDCVLEPAQRERLDFLHATYHLFYISALELLAAGAYRWGKNDHDGPTLVKLGLVLILVVFVADIKQDIWECRLLRTQETDAKLREFVQKLGFKG